MADDSRALWVGVVGSYGGLDLGDESDSEVRAARDPDRLVVAGLCISGTHVA